ncbi:hypothetical protein ACTXT7_014746 [Hymenolepis weldensis]
MAYLKPLFRSFFGLFVNLSDGAEQPGVSSKMDWDFYAIPILAGILSILVQKIVLTVTTPYVQC